MTLIPPLIYSCFNQILQLFIIVCIYLLGSLLLPAVHWHSSAHSLWDLFFLSLWHFMCFLLLLQGEQRRQMEHFEWTIGLLCLLSICSKETKKILVLSVHFDCLQFRKNYTIYWILNASKPTEYWPTKIAASTSGDYCWSSLPTSWADAVCFCIWVGNQWFRNRNKC